MVEMVFLLIKWEKAGQGTGVSQVERGPSMHRALDSAAYCSSSFFHFVVFEKQETFQ